MEESWKLLSEISWLIPALPFLGFLLVGLGRKWLGDTLSGWTATLLVMGSATLAILTAWQYFAFFGTGGDKGPAIVAWSLPWMSYQELLTVSAGVLLDPLSLMLMVVVTTVSSLVHLYSIGYMKGEEGFSRYFAILNLFTFSMLGLVLAPNLLQMFVFWELVGASSFFLIGFYFSKPSAVSASKKAFIVTRFADLGFMLGILFLAYYGFLHFQDLDALGGGSFSAAGLQVLDFEYLTSAAVVNRMMEIGGGSILTVALILLFMGAAGKSAMFPLHIWLPDAMEGPTPVSALIHAATMVVAGVYLVARMFPLFVGSPVALELVMVVGAFTCLFAAVIACTQDDIKRILAFSTLSQLGYMMLSLGVASPSFPLGYTASAFHLFTHAFFKALLFLGAGSVIHAVHSNNIWDMGGLVKKMPFTHLFVLIATLAIAGVPPLAGFYSKDEILLAALTSGHTWVFGVALLVAALTAFYMFRLYWVTFWRKPATHGAEHAHESSWHMVLPMGILAVLSVVAGWVHFGDYIHAGFQFSVDHDWRVPVIASGAAAIGIGWSSVMYLGAKVKAKGVAEALGVFYLLVKRKFMIDEIYLFVTHKIIFKFIATPVAWFDRQVVDGAMNLSAWLTRAAGLGLKQLQTGQVQTYGLWFVMGGMLVILSIWMTFSPY
ncbi:MAG: NADH-quinone oxidoreductase subunit L [Bdellovibrionaceae bacterium]|nr:NADH-quinone oxidoreductase subunit L [Pseudobdellovibrionaceae bacterium]